MVESPPDCVRRPAAHHAAAGSSPRRHCRRRRGGQASAPPQGVAGSDGARSHTAVRAATGDGGGGRRQPRRAPSTPNPHCAEPAHQTGHVGHDFLEWDVGTRQVPRSRGRPGQSPRRPAVSAPGERTEVGQQVRETVGPFRRWRLCDQRRWLPPGGVRKTKPNTSGGYSFDENVKNF